MHGRHGGSGGIGAARAAARRVGLGRWAALGAAIGVALGLAAVVGLGASCSSGRLAPRPGLAAWREPAAFGVRDGLVDLAGGNLLLRRTDLTIETRLGTQAVTHVYNSATDRWSWSFEMSYVGDVFTDDTGMRHALTGVPPGPIAGTRWRKVDGATIESRGGLRFAFGPDGSLAHVAWRHAAFPRLELGRTGDGRLRIAQCTAPGACSDVFVVRYDGAAVVEVADRAGRVVSYGWTSGRLASVQTPFERDQGLPPRRYFYALHPGGRPATVVVENPERERARYELDEDGRVTGAVLVGEESPRWAFQHGAGPPRTLVVDPLGRETELRFDPTSRLLEVHRRATGERTAFAWTGLRITRATAPDGRVTAVRYDAADEPVEWTLPGGRRIDVEYAPHAVHTASPFSALPLRVRDAGERVVERELDAQGRVVAEIDGDGARTAFHYGPLETLARIDLPSGVSVRFAEYGEHGQPGEVRLPAAGPGEPDFVARREYDAVGNLTIGADPGSESGSQFPGVVARHFDAARNVRTLVMSQSPQTAEIQDIAFVRRSDGRLRAIVRPYGARAEFDYDALGRLRAQRERVDGGWAETRFAWTPLGELARAELPNGMAQEWAYDAAGRVARRTNRRHGAVESEVVHRYEAGRLVRKEDSTAPGPTRFGYDGAGRLRSVTWPEGEQSWFTYDARDRLALTLLLRADGYLLRQIGLGYDAAGRESLLYDGAALVHEQIHAGGRLAEVRHGNGVVRQFSYDGFGRPAGAISRDAAGRELEREAIRREGYTFFGHPDPAGERRVVIVDYQASAAFGAVAFVERAMGLQFGNGQRWFSGLIPDSGTYEWCNGTDCDAPGARRYHRPSGLMDLELERLPADAAGRRADRVFLRNPERNRLHAIALQPSSPGDGAWDPVVEHHYTWDEAGFATSRDGVAIEWDATGQVARFGAATFDRDAEGRLRAARVDGVATTRRFGGLVEADAHGRPLRLDLGAVAIDLTGGGRTYRHFDWRGNVRSLWDDAGALRAVREYEAYGPARVHGDTADARGFAQGVEAAGLVLLGERLYDPAARQFLAPDPVYSVFHQHVYAAGDPVNYWDWTGRSAEASLGFRLAGAFGQAFGAVGGFLVGAALGAKTGLPPVAIGLAGVFSYQGGVLGRAWNETLYILIYDWIHGDGPPAAEPQGARGAVPGAGFSPPMALSSPRHPSWACASSECQMFWFGRPPGGPPPRGVGGPSGALALPSFAMPATACGLLGGEPLLLLAWSLRRRRGGNARRETP